MSEGAKESRVIGFSKPSKPSAEAMPEPPSAASNGNSEKTLQYSDESESHTHGASDAECRDKQPTSTGSQFETLCVSVRGWSHVKAGTPCEDFGLANEGEFFRVFAVADGHGDPNCPRSAYGSKAISEIACSELAEFARVLRFESPKEEDGLTSLERQLFDPKNQESMLRQLIRSIVGNWRDDVLGDFEQYPLTQAEREAAKGYVERYDKGERIEHVYGTTLIAGLLTDDYLLLLQQGDGRCVVFAQDGEASQPIPWDDECIANVTTSVCDVDAVERCRYYVRDVRKAPVIACVAGSDGVEDSFFSMDTMHSFYRELLLDTVNHSVADTVEYLNEYLPRFSQEGSADDVTICGFIDVSAVRQVAGRLEEESNIVDINAEIARIDDRLRSMEGKTEYLKKRRDEALKAEEDIAKRVRMAFAAREDYERSLNTFRDDGNSEQIRKLFFGLVPKRVASYLESCLAEAGAELERVQGEFEVVSEKRLVAEQELAEHLSRRDGFLKRRKELLSLKGRKDRS